MSSKRASVQAVNDDKPQPGKKPCSNDQWSMVNGCRLTMGRRILFSQTPVSHTPCSQSAVNMVIVSGNVFAMRLNSQ